MVEEEKERNEFAFSLVMPFYNEEKNIERVVMGLKECFDAEGLDYELVLVDNGSRDDTGMLAERLSKHSPRIKIVTVPENKGYGWGILKGFEQSEGRFIGFMGGDGQLSPSDVLKVLAEVSEKNIVKGKRVVRNDGWLRKVNSKIYNFLFRVMFNIQTPDVNSPPKFIPRQILAEMKLSSADWFIDAEIMIKAKNMGLKIIEVPLVFRERKEGRSNVRLSTNWEFLRNMILYKRESRCRING